jgi:apolipoprotein N-acyltransferase
VVATYRKRRLVIFGEYVPLARWLPFLRRFTGVGGDFTPGAEFVPFQLSDLKVKTSVLICFEDVFPHSAREHVEADTDFLLNLTNNGWFGESAAQWQHAASAVFRAVENGLPLVRCANNGLTCWVDAVGRLNEVFFPGSSDVYGAGFKIAHVPLLAGQQRPPTCYRRHGDWFGWTCAGFAVLTLGRRCLGQRREPARQTSDVKA